MYGFNDIVVVQQPIIKSKQNKAKKAKRTVIDIQLPI